MLVGAWIRLYFNLRHRGRTVWWIPATAALALLAIAIATRPGDAEPAGHGGGAVRASAEIVEQRCAACHSTTPTDPCSRPRRRGLAFDTPEQIRARAAAIEEQAVRTHAMPLGNVTGMTDAERALLGRWIAQGAKVAP